MTRGDSAMRNFFLLLVMILVCLTACSSPTSELRDVIEETVSGEKVQASGLAERAATLIASGADAAVSYDDTFIRITTCPERISK